MNGTRSIAIVRVTAMERALRRAADQFRDYAKQHRAKGTEDGTRKASTNDMMAEMCEEALRS